LQPTAGIAEAVIFEKHPARQRFYLETSFLVSLMIYPQNCISP
jgi:hypothetical protein